MYFGICRYQFKFRISEAWGVWILEFDLTQFSSRNFRVLTIFFLRSEISFCIPRSHAYIAFCDKALLKGGTRRTRGETARLNGGRAARIFSAAQFAPGNAASTEFMVPGSAKNTAASAVTRVPQWRRRQRRPRSVSRGKKSGLR